MLIITKEKNMMQQRANKVICIIISIIQININYSDKYQSSKFCQNRNIIDSRNIT